MNAKLYCARSSDVEHSAIELGTGNGKGFSLSVHIGFGMYSLDTRRTNHDMNNVRVNPQQIFVWSMFVHESIGA